MTLLERYLRSLSELGVGRDGRKTYHDQPRSRWFRKIKGEESWRPVGDGVGNPSTQDLLRVAEIFRQESVGKTLSGGPGGFHAGGTEIRVPVGTGFLEVETTLWENSSNQLHARQRTVIRGINALDLLWERLP